MLSYGKSMHNLSKPLRECLAIMSGGLFIGTMIWMMLLIASVQTLRHLPETNSVYVALGPLVLNTVSKQADHDTFTVSLSFELGFFWYLLGWVACSFGIWLGRNIGHPENQ